MIRFRFLFFIALALAVVVLPWLLPAQGYTLRVACLVLLFFETAFGITAGDIYGLSEVLGPGVASEEAATQAGPTIWAPHFDPEIIDPETGEVLERLDMPPGTGVSGLESDGGERFFCGGGSSGLVRAVRRPWHALK